ncbi:phasin family protein [Sphingomonas sp. 8AM]|uniref:phasin family protein n=1 Tax=Sphingomonas sp. 8AM TaxID=2653170 RepID=UPI0012F40481|nr:phasin family protein [Sphingomonas sp. 8AM]VXC83258.1 conserved hypothetical protein [Sphingomonas sp. 8AM]
MVDQTGKVEGRKTVAPSKGRVRAVGKPALPPLPAEPDVPAVLANPTLTDAPAPVVIAAAEPVAAGAENATATAPAPAPVIDEPIIQPQPAAAAAPLETKDTNMTDTVTTFADKAQDQAKAFADKAQEQGRAAFNNAGEQARVALDKSRKVAEDLAEFGKGNVEALVESSRIAAQAFEAIGQDAATFARARYDSTAQLIQTLASVKSPTEALQLHAEYVRASFDALVKEASRSTEATLKLAGDVAKPLQNRVAVAADKFRTAA